MSKPIIFCFVGSSGSGKTMVTEHVSKCLGIEVIRSYTTRPMRNGETDGVEHFFVSEKEMPSKEDMIAYTFFGGYHYWATKKQASGNRLYVIDEDGLRMLAKDHGEEYILLPIYITRKDSENIDIERKERDMERKRLDMRAYVNVFENRDKYDFIFDVVSYIKLCLNNESTFETWYNTHRRFMV